MEIIAYVNEYTGRLYRKDLVVIEELFEEFIVREMFTPLPFLFNSLSKANASLIVVNLLTGRIHIDVSKVKQHWKDGVVVSRDHPINFLNKLLASRVNCPQMTVPNLVE